MKLCKPASSSYPWKNFEKVYPQTISMGPLGHLQNCQKHAKLMEICGYRQERGIHCLWCRCTYKICFHNI